MRIVRMLMLAVPVCVLAHASAAQTHDAPTLAAGRPANLCQELVAFVHQPAAGAQAADTPPRLATAVSAKNNSDASAKPAAETTPQSSSGQSAQITASGPGAAGPQGQAQNLAAPAGSTATASGPERSGSSTQPDTSKPSAENVTQIEAAARTNDLPACRAAAQSMRRAGVVMPAPLLALAAMTPKLLEGASSP
ncbi:hypothetical protein E4V01_22575 [Methylorubrum sp. Q1]|nr:hypothetical protein E4V01_22575 [Methylorubrum sp. Q1]